MLNSSNPEFGLVLGLGGGIWAFFKGFRVYREYKVVEDTPRVPIRSVPMGLVRVRGRAQSEQLVKSPVSHTPCCFYKVDIEHWKVEHDSGSWSHYRTDTDGPKFFLEDETGKVLVDAHSAEYELVETVKREVRSDSSGTGPSVVSAASAGASDSELLQYVSYAGVSKVTHFVEGLLEKRGALGDPRREQARQAMLQLLHSVPRPGEEITISPEARMQAMESLFAMKGPAADPEKELQRQEAMAHFREMASQKLPELTIPGAQGRYHFTEYLILPGQEYNVTGSCVENPDSKDAHDRNLVMKGHNEPTLIISSKDEKAVPGGLRKKAAWMIFGGAGVAFVCLLLLLIDLKML